MGDWVGQGGEQGRRSSPRAALAATHGDEWRRTSYVAAYGLFFLAPVAWIHFGEEPQKPGAAVNTMAASWGEAAVADADGAGENVKKKHPCLLCLGGELIEMLPTADCWVLPVTAWLRNPCAVPKVLTITVPAPVLPPIKPDSDEDVESPLPPSSPTKKCTQDYYLLIHVKEVIDRGPLLTEGITGVSSSDNDEDLSSRHTFKT